MAHTFKIDFYAVEIPEDAPAFERLVMDDATSNDDETRTLEIEGYPIRLQDAQSIPAGVIEADMLKIQMAELPPRAKLSGRVRNLNLDTDEGIGGETAFLYDPRTKVLVLQRNKNGVSARSLARYFESKAQSDSPIVLAPIIQKDALDRLSRMKETRKLKVRFAAVTNPDFFRGADVGLGEMVDVLEYFRAPTGSFEISMGHQRGSLWSTRITALARRLFNRPSAGTGDVTTMEVSGVLDDDSRDKFDVLLYRMVETGTLQVNDRRRSPYSMRRPEIKRAWQHRRQELAAMFKA